MSSRSYDGSKASAYYTPTDDVLSPQVPQMSPIHINHEDTDECSFWLPSEIIMRKSAKRYLDLKGGCSKDPKRVANFSNENDGLTESFMEDYYRDALEDDNYPQCSNLSNYLHHELMPLQHNIKEPTPSTSYLSQKSRHRRQRSSATIEYYYSMEDVVTVGNDDYSTASTTPRNVTKKQSSKVELDEGNIVTALVKVENNIDVHKNLLKMSDSMPDIIFKQEKKIIISMENSASVK